MSGRRDSADGGATCIANRVRNTVIGRASSPPVCGAGLADGIGGLSSRSAGCSRTSGATVFEEAAGRDSHAITSVDAVGTSGACLAK